MYTTWNVSVPGRFDGVFLDLETRKVPTDGFVMRNGEPLRRRWSAFLAGVARDRRIQLVQTDDEGGELGFLSGLGAVLAGSAMVCYAATREFDEMILRGRFTNARRAHELEPFFPAMPGVELLKWRNLGPLSHPPFRDYTNDVQSRDVWEAWCSEGSDRVLVHLLRDVAEMVLSSGNPDRACAAWCVEILQSYSAAWAEIFGGE